MSTTIIISKTINKLGERYPFNETEIEILARCYDHFSSDQGGDDFLIQLALASPYSFFFVPGDEMRKRVTWIKDHVLPKGFSNHLQAALSADPFVEFANQGEEKSLERFIEGVAATGRRGPKEALRILFNTVGEPQPRELAEIPVRLALAADALVSSTFKEIDVLNRLQALDPAMGAIAGSLTDFCNGEHLTLKIFVEWAEKFYPVISSPLSTFVHTLLFHGHPFPQSRLAYQFPQLESNKSKIFATPVGSSALMSLSFTAPEFMGTWNNLYSSFLDGRSFRRMEWTILGYSQPTVVLILTTTDALLGAFVTSPWKESIDFFGTSDSFLFQLSPKLKIYRPVMSGDSKNFVYLHTDSGSPLNLLGTHGLPRGLGFGGTLSAPRLFIPDSFERCTACSLDKTYEPGDLLAPEAMERFEIKCIEIWAVGGHEVIAKGLGDRDEHRKIMEDTLLRARMVHDKNVFAEDLKSGLIPGSQLFAHHEHTRGRQEFMVDEGHGGYKVDPAHK